MPKLRFRDFVIQVGLTPDGGFRARVLRSPAGEGETTQPLPPWLGLLSPGPFEDAGPARDVKRRHLPNGAPEEIGLGARLHELIFSGKVGRLWDQSLGAVRDRRGDGLRLRLQIDLESSPALAELPWELLHQRDTGVFLALDQRTPILRHLEVAQPVLPLPLPPGLKILVVAAAPSDLEALDLAREAGELSGRNRQGGWQVELLRQPTVEELRRVLIEKGAHVLHFMGHGDFDPERQEGALYFEDGKGKAAAWTGEALAAKLAGAPTLRLVVLNACQTAVIGQGANPYGGVAAALVRGGLPAVVAMQRPISDAAAIAFSKAFYRKLAAGEDLELALAEGRQAIHTLNPNNYEWAIPVLFARATSLGFSKHRFVPRSLHGTLAAVLALLLGVQYLPRPSRAEVLLKLETGFVRFQPVSPGQRLLGRLVARNLGATGLERIELPRRGQSPDRHERPRGLDLWLEIPEGKQGSIRLEQAALPPNSWVAIGHRNGGLDFVLKSADGKAVLPGFDAVVQGSYRAVVRTPGEAPAHLESEAAVPQVVRFWPRGHSARWEAGLGSFSGEELRSPIAVGGLEFFEREESEAGAEPGSPTRLAAKFDLSGEVAVEDAPALSLAPGSRLRLDEPRGTLQRIAPGENGIGIVFAGSVAGIRSGPRENPRDLMPRRTPAAQIATRTLAALSFLLILAEIAGFLRWLVLRIRLRLASRSAAAKGLDS